MDELLFIIWIPLVAGLLFLLLPESLRRVTAYSTVVITGAAFAFAIALFAGKGLAGDYTLCLVPQLADRFPVIDWFFRHFGALKIDDLVRLLLLLITFFSFIITLYSVSYTVPNHKIRGYYSWILITMSFSSLAVLSDHLLFFIFCWGILGITLYKLIKGADDDGAAT